MSDQTQEKVNCNPGHRLKGVQIVFEDENGKLRCGWLNIGKLRGFTWCDAPAPQGKPPTGGKNKVSFIPGPDVSDCDDIKPMTAETDLRAPICWWTGSRWECGDN